ncbi:PQQ-binding-like beta-propeller repeat protein, partial [Streptomyces sp. W16]|uniref:outer membrane protein assembly factor BamB family protein n=1 Tax=Streptomyces sp. W16 TaxID=3076631 RepID=UPI00295B66FC
PRLPAPAAEDGTTDVTSVSGPSRRGLLAVSGVLAATAAAGGVWWYRGREHTTTPAAKATPQTRNLEPLWQYGGKDLDVLGWGLVVPYQADGSIWLPLNATAERLAPTTGRVQGEVRVTANWWQTAVQEGQLYLLGHDPAQAGESVSVDTWNDGADAVRPTPAVLTNATPTLVPNQLLCVFGDIAYVSVGQGQVPADKGFLPAQTWTLRAVDLGTGRTLWTQTLPQRSSGSRRLHFVAARVVGERLVTLQATAETQTQLVVRDIRSGAVLWDTPYNVSDPDAIRGELAVDERYLYLGGSPLRALRLSDGAPAWATEAGKIYGPPTPAKGVVYTVGSGIGLTALDAATGKVLWTEATTEATEAYTLWQPVVGTRYAYYRNGLQLRAVNLADHRTVLTYRTTGKHFHAYPEARLVLAVDDDRLSAYPLR